MTHKEKKALYESIMDEISEIVLNELKIDTVRKVFNKKHGGSFDAARISPETYDLYADYQNSFTFSLENPFSGFDAVDAEIRLKGDDLYDVSIRLYSTRNSDDYWIELQSDLTSDGKFDDEFAEIDFGNEIPERLSRRFMSALNDGRPAGMLGKKDAVTMSRFFSDECGIEISPEIFIRK